MMKKIKQICGAFGNKLVKHSGAISSVCVTSIIFMALIFWMQISHASDALKLTIDKAAVQIQLEQHKMSLGEASVLIQEQNAQLNSSENLIEMQHNVIQKLIERLRDLNEWPPRKSIDPRKII